jgi:hypothetical protein
LVLLKDIPHVGLAVTLSKLAMQEGRKISHKKHKKQIPGFALYAFYG